ncbi:MAG TPA: sugar phosphate isomerase/epimerase [Candidatus Acidoferrales bacterium]|nr:sugar phosphate isomerase/epimerase [Candidatus Acidoferrales bacterium]
MHEDRALSSGLAAEQVLAEAVGLGFEAIEAGPEGFLPNHSTPASKLLKRFKLKAVAAFVPAVLHHHDIRRAELSWVDGHARWLSALGAEVLVLAAIHGRAGRRPPDGLSPTGWAHLLHSIGSVEEVCARHHLKVALHPHFGSLIERPADIERILVGCEAGICLDPAHLMLGGADPVELIHLAGSRIKHVHLKDLDAWIAARVTAGDLDYAEAVARGLFRPLGEGDAKIAEVLRALGQVGYQGWYVLEQDFAYRPAQSDPLADIRRSLDFMRGLDEP